VGIGGHLALGSGQWALGIGAWVGGLLQRLLVRRRRRLLLVNVREQVGLVLALRVVEPLERLGMQLGTQQTALHARARLGLLESFGGGLQPCEDLGVVLRADALRRGASRSRAVIRARCGRHGRRARQGGWIRRVSLGKPPPPLQGAAGGARALER